MRATFTGIIPLLEPADHQAGVDFDSFSMEGMAGIDIVLTFGAVTADAVLSAYSGATAAAKTTALPFKYTLSSGDFKAASADLFGTEAADADGVLTLTAGTYDHRLLVIHIDAVDLPVAAPWVTIDLSNAADVLLVAAVGIPIKNRYQPAPTALA